MQRSGGRKSKTRCQDLWLTYYYIRGTSNCWVKLEKHILWIKKCSWSILVMQAKWSFRPCCLWPPTTTKWLDETVIFTQAMLCCSTIYYKVIIYRSLCRSVRLFNLTQASRGEAALPVPSGLLTPQNLITSYFNRRWGHRVRRQTGFRDRLQLCDLWYCLDGDFFGLWRGIYYVSYVYVSCK